MNSGVLQPLYMDPPRLAFGEINRSAESVQRTATITRGDGDPIKPRLVGRKKEGIEASIREIEAGERYELDVKITHPYPNAGFRVPLQIETGIKQVPSLYYYAVVSIAPRVYLSPREFTVPLPTKEPFEQTLSVIQDGRINAA